MDMQTILEANKNISHYLKPTPLLFSTVLRRDFKKQIWLKLETQNPTGSFKPRPAFNSMLKHLEEAQDKGVIASSSGNFAQGVAYAAKQLGVNAIIVMTENTSAFKIERTRALGAEVVLCSNSHKDRLETTLRLQKETRRVLLQPYDSEETIAGDATIGLEIHDQLGDQLNDMTVLVPVSGGGLIAGISYALKNLNNRCKVIGVQSSANASLYKSLKAGHPVNVGSFQTIADALVASEPGAIPFSIIEHYVDDVLLVEEDTIQKATRYYLDQHKLVVEPGAATTLAAVMEQQIKSDKLLFVISGGNVQLKTG